MSNVLPKDAKRAVWRMYRARFVVAGSLVFLAAAGLSALSLLPGYLVLHAAAPVSAIPDMPKVSGSDTDRAAIASIRAMIKALDPLTATTTPTMALARALSLRPSGITIDHITYSAGSAGNLSTAILAGSASTREALNGYRQALSADWTWKTAFVPIGDLTGEPGSRFSLTLSGSF